MTKKTFTVECLECKQEFEAERRWQKFCCNKHRFQWHKMEKDREIERLKAQLKQVTAA